VLEFLGEIQDSPTKIFIDSTSSIDLCTILKVTQKTAPINMRVNFIRECIHLQHITLIFIPSEHNAADVLIKLLAHDLFANYSSKLMTGFGGIEIHTYIVTALITISCLSNLDELQD
jgi:hypothetical protein